MAQLYLKWYDEFECISMPTFISCKLYCEAIGDGSLMLWAKVTPYWGIWDRRFRSGSESPFLSPPILIIPHPYSYHGPGDRRSSRHSLPFSKKFSFRRLSHCLYTWAESEGSADRNKAAQQDALRKYMTQGQKSSTPQLVLFLTL